MPYGMRLLIGAFRDMRKPLRIHELRRRDPPPDQRLGHVFRSHRALHRQQRHTSRPDRRIRAHGPAHLGHWVADDHETDIKRARVLELANDALVKLDSTTRVAADDVEIIAADPSEYGGAETQTFDIIRQLASTEGIVTDPVYEGKALRGLDQLLKEDRFDTDAKVLLMHLGGAPAVHAYANHFGTPTFKQPML